MSKKAGMRKFAINCSIAVHPRPLPSINIVIYPFHTVFVVMLLQPETQRERVLDELEAPSHKVLVFYYFIDITFFRQVPHFISCLFRRKFASAQKKGKTNKQWCYTDVLYRHCRVLTAKHDQKTWVLMIYKTVRCKAVTFAVGVFVFVVVVVIFKVKNTVGTPLVTTKNEKARWSLTRSDLLGVSSWRRSEQSTFWERILCMQLRFTQFHVATKI